MVSPRPRRIRALGTRSGVAKTRRIRESKVQTWDTRRAHRAYHAAMPFTLPARLAAAGLLLLLSPGPAHAQAPAPPSLDAVSWMAGCWSFTAGDRTVDEQWMRPAAGVMLGMSRARRGERLTSLEFSLLRIDSGRLVYEARPEGQAGAVFPLISATAGEAVFENTAHDFPQRIIYRRDGSHGLKARIEGPGPAGVRGVDYPFARVACP